MQGRYLCFSWKIWKRILQMVWNRSSEAQTASFLSGNLVTGVQTPYSVIQEKSKVLNYFKIGKDLHRSRLYIYLKYGQLVWAVTDFFSFRETHHDMKRLCGSAFLVQHCLWLDLHIESRMFNHMYCSLLARKRTLQLQNQIHVYNFKPYTPKGNAIDWTDLNDKWSNEWKKHV